MEEWTKEAIASEIENNEAAFIYLYTPLCGTCQVAGKMIEVVSLLFPDVRFGKADLNYLPEVAERFEVESVPCLLIFKNGSLQEKVYAFQSVPFLREKLLSYIA